MEAENLRIFPKFENAKNQIFVLSFQKNHGWPRNWGKGWSKTGGLCPLGPGLKPPLPLVLSIDTTVRSPKATEASVLLCYGVVVTVMSVGNRVTRMASVYFSGRQNRH